MYSHVQESFSSRNDGRKLGTKNKIVFYFAQYNLSKRHTRAIVISNEATAQTSTKSNLIHLYCKSTNCSND